jgi:hypothetical protein
LNEAGRKPRASRLLLEMLVVVASILIAFALDAWWDKRAEARTEAAHLRALEADFAQNVSRLQSFIVGQEQIADASRRLLLVARAPGVPPADTVARLLPRVFTSVRFDAVMGAYEAVVSSGGLVQVRDDSLRLALADFASLLEGRYYERYADALYFEFLRSFAGRLGMDAALIAVEAGASAQAAAVSANGLLRDPRFREHLALRHAAERDVANTYRALLERAEKVLGLTRRTLR